MGSLRGFPAEPVVRTLCRCQDALKLTRAHAAVVVKLAQCKVRIGWSSSGSAMGEHSAVGVQGAAARRRAWRHAKTRFNDAWGGHRYACLGALRGAGSTVCAAVRDAATASSSSADLVSRALNGLMQACCEHGTCACLMPACVRLSAARLPHRSPEQRTPHLAPHLAQDCLELAQSSLRAELKRCGQERSRLEAEQERRERERKAERDEWSARQALHRTATEAQRREAAAREADVERMAREDERCEWNKSQADGWKRAQAAQEARDRAAAEARVKAELERERLRKEEQQRAREHERDRAAAAVAAAKAKEVEDAAAKAARRKEAQARQQSAGREAAQEEAAGGRQSSSGSSSWWSFNARARWASGAASRRHKEEVREATEENKGSRARHQSGRASAAGAPPPAPAAAVAVPPQGGAPQGSAAQQAAREAAERQQAHRSTVQKEQKEALLRVMRARASDPHAVLGVPVGSSLTLTAKDITKLFRQQSLLIHPDKNSAPEAEEAFKKLQVTPARVMRRPCMVCAWLVDPLSHACCRLLVGLMLRLMLHL